MALKINDIEITLKFVDEIPILNIYENCLTLFSEYPEISRFRDEDGLYLLLSDEEGINYVIRKDEIIINGSTNLEHLRKKSNILSSQILKFLKRENEKPEINSIEYDASKDNSFSISDLYKKVFLDVAEDFKVELPGVLFLLPEKTVAYIRHKTRSDSDKGNIKVSTNNIELTTKFIDRIESVVKKR